MYHVLLVDDEPFALEGLRDFIPWEEYGFQVQGCALNVEEAFRLIAGQPPELVITDICMPERNGIDLISSLKEAAPDTRVIVLSGYGEFEYARAALQYGAAAYLLKPVDRAELCSLLTEIGASLEEKRRLRQSISLHEQNVDKYVGSILAGRPDEKAGIHADAFFDVCREEQRLLFFELGLFLPLDAEPDEDTVKRLLREELAREFSLNEPFALAAAGMERLFLILRWEGSAQELELRLEKLSRSLRRLGWDLALYAGGAGKTHGCYPERIRECALCADRCFYRFAPDAGRLPPEAAQVLSLSRERGWGLEELFRRQASPVLMRAAVQELAGAMAEAPAELSSRLLRQLKRLSFLQICRGLLRLHAAAEAADGEERAVEKVLRYVREHYREDLQLQKLAEQFYFNANYLGKALRQVLHVPLRDYLHELRIEEARRLLAENRLPIAEIAEILGYRDADTFSEHFRKLVGQSPSAYRKERLGR